MKTIQVTAIKYGFVVFFVSAALLASAQAPARVVLHLQSADTLVHKSVVNQISNLKKEIPGLQMELVCHGPGLTFLMKDKSMYADRLHAQKISDLVIVGCEFTMQQRGLTKADLVPFTGTVPFGIAEIVKKQQAGWLYVKLGF